MPRHESESDYRKDVLKVFNQDHRRLELLEAITELQANSGSVPSRLDLTFLYAMSEGMTDAQCAEQVSWVLSAFNRSRMIANYSHMAPLLIELHDLLADRTGHPSLGSAAFWSARFVAKIVKAEYASYGVITPDLLRQIATSCGLDGLTDDVLADGARGAGIQTSWHSGTSPQVRA